MTLQNERNHFHLCIWTTQYTIATLFGLIAGIFLDVINLKVKSKETNTHLQYWCGNFVEKFEYMANSWRRMRTEQLRKREASQQNDKTTHTS